MLPTRPLVRFDCRRPAMRTEFARGEAEPVLVQERQNRIENLNTNNNELQESVTELGNMIRCQKTTIARMIKQRKESGNKVRALRNDPPQRELKRARDRQILFANISIVSVLMCNSNNSSILSYKVCSMLKF